jgi:hypothetical protein
MDGATQNPQTLKGSFDLLNPTSDPVDEVSERSLDGAERNPGPHRRLAAIPDYAPLHPGYGANTMDQRKQKTWMAGSSPAMSIRIVACESLPLKTRRDEPPLGVDVI